MKLAMRVPQMERHKDFPIKKVKIQGMNNPSGRSIVTTKDFPFPRTFPSISERKDDAFNSFLLSLKRKLGG